MNKPWIIALASAALMAGCSSQSEEAAGDANASQPPPESMSGSTVTSELRTEIIGTVAETMDSGGYTYVLVDTGSEKVWAATREVAVAVGDDVNIPTPMLMVDYHSGTLDRTFERIYFAESIRPPGQVPAGHGVPAPAPAVDLAGIEKAEGGVTVEEVFRRKDELVGTEIVLRGKVVKYNAQILEKNWLHVQDGTGAAGANDLTVTTTATADVGDVVLVRGVLEADVDFGHGYAYDLILQDAQVSVEQAP